jgi:hypothetical protein
MQGEELNVCYGDMYPTLEISQVWLKQAPTPPFGVTVTRTRMYMRGIDLQNKILAGLKWSTARCWTKEYEQYHRERIGEVCRVQSAYNNASIFAFARVASISARGHPDDLITPYHLRQAGCAHMTKAAYIAEYCYELVGKIWVFCEEIVCVYFQAFWNHHGIPIECAM